MTTSPTQTEAERFAAEILQIASDITADPIQANLAYHVAYSIAAHQPDASYEDLSRQVESLVHLVPAREHPATPDPFSTIPIDCPRHGPGQRIASEDSYSGYAGGACYVVTLTCGCADTDESADVRAAR